jgi:hypothetical protein
MGGASNDVVNNDAADGEVLEDILEQISADGTYDHCFKSPIISLSPRPGNQAR